MTEDYFLPVERALSQFINGEYSPRDAKRLIHGRGGCFPGLQWCVIDAFAPTVFVTVFSVPPEDFEGRLVELLNNLVFKKEVEPTEPAVFTGLAIQYRYLLDAPCKWLIGSEPEQSIAQRGDLKFHIRFTTKNVGYFLDMEPGREWLEQRVKNKAVLNLFAFTCAFSVVAHAAGARKIVNVDMSSKVLSIGRRNHQLNNQSTDNVQFLGLDILKSWSRIRKPGPYGAIIIDPPSFQKGSFIATKDYAKVLRRIHEFAEEGADILACLNAPELDCQFLIDLFAEHAPLCQYQGRLPCSPDFKDVNEQKQLKLLHFRYESDNSFCS